MIRFALPGGVGLFLLSLSTLIYHSQKEEKMDHFKSDSLLKLSQQTECKSVIHALMKHENKLEKPTDELSFEPTILSGSMPLQTLFMLLLIHTCGAGLVSSFSKMFVYMSSTGILLDLAVSFFLAVYVRYKWKCETAELQEKNSQLQEESRRKDEDREDVVTTLMEVKTELENQRRRLTVHLEEVEAQRAANKQELQAVEDEITQREVKFDKPQELLTEKENLLRAQWKLDEIKKENDKQLLNTERLLEPIEIQVARGRRKKEVEFG